MLIMQLFRIKFFLISGELSIKKILFLNHQHLNGLQVTNTLPLKSMKMIMVLDSVIIQEKTTAVQHNGILGNLMQVIILFTLECVFMLNVGIVYSRLLEQNRIKLVRFD